MAFVKFKPTRARVNAKFIIRIGSNKYITFPKVIRDAFNVDVNKYVTLWHDDETGLVGVGFSPTEGDPDARKLATNYAVPMAEFFHRHEIDFNALNTPAAFPARRAGEDEIPADAPKEFLLFDLKTGHSLEARAKRNLAATAYA